jgi:hypothetical protein
MSYVHTLPIDLAQQKEDLAEVLGLDLSQVVGISVEPEQVLFTAHWVKYAEHKIEVPVVVLDLPHGWVAKTFPHKVEVLFRAPIEQLKSPSVTDFKIYVHYSQLQAENGLSHWPLVLEVINPAIERAYLSHQHVELIVQKP